MSQYTKPMVMIELAEYQELTKPSTEKEDSKALTYIVCELMNAISNTCQPEHYTVIRDIHRYLDAKGIQLKMVNGTSMAFNYVTPENLRWQVTKIPT